MPTETNAKLSQAEKKQLIKEVPEWIITTALNNSQVVAAKGSLQKLIRKDENPTLSKLVHDGCDDDVLLNTIAFAAELPNLYPPFSAQELRELAKDVESVLSRMRRLTPSIALPIVTTTSKGKNELRLEPTGDVFHVWPQLEHDLCLKIAAYKMLAQLCTNHEIPTRAEFKTITCVFPLLYVRRKIGEPRFAAVSRLLEFAGISKNAKQLRIALRKAETKYSAALFWMETAIGFLQQCHVPTAEESTVIDELVAKYVTHGFQKYRSPSFLVKKFEPLKDLLAPANVRLKQRSSGSWARSRLTGNPK